MRRAAFLDRDGTLNVDLVRSVDISRLQLMPRVPEAIRLWNDAGWRVIVVTNQSGIGRGLYTRQDMDAFHEEIRRRVESATGGHIDAFRHCPHVPDAGCACRKPGHALLSAAIREGGIDAAGSIMVGDTWRDVVAGKAVGVRTAWVPPVPGADYDASCLAEYGSLVSPDLVAGDILEAAEWSLG